MMEYEFGEGEIYTHECGERVQNTADGLVIDAGSNVEHECDEDD